VGFCPAFPGKSSPEATLVRYRQLNELNLPQGPVECVRELLCVVFVEDQGRPNFQYVAKGAVDPHQHSLFAHVVDDSSRLFCCRLEGRVVAYQFHADEQSTATHVANQGLLLRELFDLRPKQSTDTGRAFLQSFLFHRVTISGTTSWASNPQR